MKLLLLATALLATSACSKREASPSPKIIKEDLVQRGSQYEVIGTIHNPHKEPVRDVVISYEVWRNLKDRSKSVYAQKDGGRVFSVIKYLPAGASVDFVASGKSPVMPAEAGVVPDTLKAEISAKWADAEE